MSTAFYCVLVASLLPILWTGVAKFSGPGFNNFKPRDFQASLSGWRQRAHWAHLNSFEALPPFAAAVIIAHLLGGARPIIDQLALAWVGFRLLYGIFYLTNSATLRSIMWFLATVCWIYMYFA